MSPQHGRLGEPDSFSLLSTTGARNPNCLLPVSPPSSQAAQLSICFETSSAHDAEMPSLASAAAARVLVQRRRSFCQKDAPASAERRADRVQHGP